MTVLKSVSLCRYDLYLISFIQKTFNILKHLFIFHCLHGSTCTMVLMWRSEVNLQELILSFHPVGTKNRTWLIRLGGKHLYQQSHLTTSLILVFFNVWLSYHLDFYNFRIYLSLKKNFCHLDLDDIGCAWVSKIYEYQSHIKVSLLRWSSFLCRSVCWQFFEGCCFLHFFFHLLVSVEARMVCLYQTSSLVQGSVQ